MWSCYKTSSVGHVAYHAAAAALCLWHAELGMETDGCLTQASRRVAKV